MRIVPSFLSLSILIVGGALQAAPNTEKRTSPVEVVDAGTYTARDGRRFTFVKESIGGRSQVTFRSDDLVLDRAGMQRYEAAHPNPKIDPALLAQAEAAPETNLSLVVWLDHQPAVPLAREIRQAYQAELDHLAEEVRAVHRPMRPLFPLDEAEERAWIALDKASRGGLSDTAHAWLRDRAIAIEAVRDRMRSELADQIGGAVAADQAALALLVTELGGRVARQISFANAATIVIPASSLPHLVKDARIARIEALKPGRPELDLQKRSLGLDVAGGFWDDGFAGATYDAGVLDTGVQQDHPALDHLRYESMVGTSDSDGHGTAIAGIIASDDADSSFGCFTDGFFCGTAWDMDTLLVGSSDALDVLADADWMVTTATEGPEAINLSAGFGTADDVDYSGFDAFFDALVDAAGITVCTSAGDGGVAASTALTHPANAYNVISVANMNDQNTASRNDDVSAASSSRGPTLGGRKKPDLTAPGELTRTTDNDWATGPDFVDVSGTSAAAPHCTGAALLLADRLGTADPLAIKAVLLNSADAWRDNGTPADTSDDSRISGSQWNSTYGWGYLDLQEANFHAQDTFTDTLGDGSGAEPTFRLYTGFLFPDEKATLVWNRHVDRAGAGEPAAIEDLTDLDLELYTSASNLQAVSASLLDNVEQVAGTGYNRAVVKVKLNGPIDPDVGTQSFVLATEDNWTEASFPVLGIGPPHRPLAPGRRAHLIVAPEVTGSEVNTLETTVTLPPGYSILEGDNPQTSAGTFNWTIQTPCTTDPGIASFLAKANVYGEVVTRTTDYTLRPTVEALVPDSFVRRFGTERTFGLPVQDGRWSAVAMRPAASGAQLDLWGDDDLCIDSPYQTSTATGTNIEMILANGTFYGDTTHQALVRSNSGTLVDTANYWVEYEPARTLPFDGTTLDARFADRKESIELFQIPVVAGRWYEVHATLVGTGLMDVAILGYEADRDDADIQNPNFIADFASGPLLPSTEETYLSTLFQAQSTGAYALVLLNQVDFAGAQGTWAVGAREGLFGDNCETGDTSNWSATTP